MKLPPPLSGPVARKSTSRVQIGKSTVFSPQAPPRWWPGAIGVRIILLERISGGFGFPRRWKFGTPLPFGDILLFLSVMKMLCKRNLTYFPLWPKLRSLERNDACAEPAAAARAKVKNDQEEGISNALYSLEEDQRSTNVLLKLSRKLNERGFRFEISLTGFTKSVFYLVVGGLVLRTLFKRSKEDLIMIIVRRVFLISRQSTPVNSILIRCSMICRVDISDMREGSII